MADRYAQAVVYIYRSAWAGFTLLILIWGQCESLNVGIGAERNFTPTSFFVSVPFGAVPFLNVNESDDQQGEQLAEG